MIQLHWEEGDLDVAIKGKKIPKVRSYSKVSIIRPGCSKLLEFDKKLVLVVYLETFFKYPDQVV
jgi:hypothetical protein